MRPLPLAAFAIFALLAAACGGGGGGEATAGGASKTIEIAETEFALDPSTVSIDEPGTYTFRAVNQGKVEHALEIEGHGVEEETEKIAPGETAELTVELNEAGDYEMYCPVDDHKGMGMRGEITVE
jgi:uncharacterized cupredoxin-like copper-binding protein